MELQAEENEPKRRKGAEGSSSVSNKDEPKNIVPSVTLSEHSGTISALCWPHPLALYSGAWDRTIKQWDTQKGENVRSWSSVAAATAMEFSTSENLLLSGHWDRFVRVWDPRIGDRPALKMTLRSHEKAITSVSWGTGNNFVSSSRDGTIKTWDLRSNFSISSAALPDKVCPLVVDWADNSIFSGADDNQMRVHKPFLSQ